MRKERDLKTDFLDNKVFLAQEKGYSDFYYEVVEDFSYSTRKRINDIDFMFSEWMEVFNSRLDILKEQGITNGMPIITEEECYKWGL